MIIYEVTIKGSNDTIEFKADETNQNQAITGVQFKFNSDDNTKDRDRNGRVELVVYGKFDARKETLDNIKNLAEWSKDKNNVYREVTITYKTTDNNESDGNFQRTFHFDKMFCIDYTEKYGVANTDGKEDDGLSFELFMAQAPTYKISETLAEQI